MAQRTVNAFVVIGGRVDNSFGQIGSALIGLGSTIDEISQKLINFGKESVDVYRGFEDSMLDARVALSTTYGRATRELEAVMTQLDQQAADWAASTIFHTDDVANAIAEAAHANWDLEEILDGIPAAMRLAQAGSLDLSQSVDYIIKSTNAAGISFGDLTDFIDEWTYAANSSAGNVEQFGEAMTRMGATMKFADSKEELLTMLAVLHDAGTVGSDAGTLLRNSMIRLVAPTKKASDMMASLGVTQADIDEAMSEVSGDTKAVLKDLEKLGFTVYDSNGDLKDFATIFSELAAVTADMSDEKKYDVWSAIFPTRTITGAMALMEAALNDWNGLYDALNSGDAEGYGEYAAETMMSGLTGSIETFNSKLEELKRAVGGELSGQLESIAASGSKILDFLNSGTADNGVSAGLNLLERFAGFAGDIAENLGTMDPKMFDALSGALGSFALLGGELVIGGSVMRALGFIFGTPAGRIALTIAAFAAVTEGIKAWQEADFNEKFGTMDLDTTELDTKLAEIGEKFKASTEEITAYGSALTTSIENYETAAQTFSSTMLTDLLTQKPLTQDDLDKYINMGDQMIGAVKTGITQSANMSASFWAALFKDNGKGDEEIEGNPVFAGIIGLLQDEKSEALKEVEGIGADMRKAIAEAIGNDGIIDEAEYEQIKVYFEALNDAMVRAEREAQNEQEYVNRRKMMSRAQTMSYADAMSYIESDIMPQRQEELDFWKDNYESQIFAAEYRYLEQFKAAGDDIEKQREVDRHWNEKYGSIGTFSGGEATFAPLEKELQEKLNGVYGEYDQFILGFYNNLLGNGELSAMDSMIEGLISDMFGRRLTESEAFNAIRESGLIRGDFNESGIAGMYEDAIKALGGSDNMHEAIDVVERRIADYERNGRTADANALRTMLGKYAFSRNDAWGNRSSLGEELFPQQWEDLTNEQRALREAPYWAEVEAENELFTKDTEAPLVTQLYAAEQEIDELRKDIANLNYEYGLWEDDTSEWSENRKRQIEGELAEKQALLDQDIALAATAREAIEGIDDEFQPVEQEVTFPDAIKTAKNTHDEMAKAFTPIPQYVYSIFRSPDTAQTANTESAQLSLAVKAKGGRETRPAIFAEAGLPEWFIPEEHTNITARLILGAMLGSGFSLFDLAEMSGADMFAEGGVTDGGSAISWGEMPDTGSGSTGSGIQITYSPVIHADNADGVRRVLEDDKKRLKKQIEEWWEDKQLYESMVRFK